MRAISSSDIQLFTSSESPQSSQEFDLEESDRGGNTIIDPTQEMGEDRTSDSTAQLLGRIAKGRTKRDSEQRAAVDFDKEVVLMSSQELRNGLIQDGIELPSENAVINEKKSDGAVLEEIWSKYLNYAPGSNERIVMIPRVLLQIDAIRSNTGMSNIPTLINLRKQVVFELEKSKNQTIEKNVHFFWTGSLPKLTQTYIKIIIESSPKDLNFSLGYDPRGYMARRMRSAIYRAAQARINDLSLPLKSRNKVYYESVLELQNEAFAWMKAASTVEEFSQRAIDFMVNRLGQNRKTLEDFLQKAKDSFKDFESELKLKYGDRFQLVDVSSMINKDHPCYEIYMQEMWLRGQLAACSDLERMCFLQIKGGTYMDADAGPKLRDDIFDKRVSDIEGEILNKIKSSVEDFDDRPLKEFFQTVKFQAVDNFIAQRDKDKIVLKNDAIFDMLRERIQNSLGQKASEKFAFQLKELKELGNRYIELIQLTPEEYMKRHYLDSFLDVDKDVSRLFQPLKQPKVLPNGIAVQERPIIVVGFDGNVLHGKKDAPVFKEYWKLVKQRYERLKKNDLVWDQKIPDRIYEEASYRLDGLRADSAASGNLTAAAVLKEAVGNSLLENVQDKDLRDRFLKIFGKPKKYWHYIKDILTSPRVVTMETPADLDSVWRADEILPQKFDFAGDSKYDKQIVIQLDDSGISELSARYFNNHHKNSILLKYDHKNGKLLRQELSGQYKIISTPLDPKDWGDNPRVVLVANPIDGKVPLSAKKVARIINKIVPSGPGIKSIARIKLAWDFSDATLETDVDESHISIGQGWLNRLRARIVSLTRAEQNRDRATTFTAQLLKRLQRTDATDGRGTNIKTTLKVYNGPIEVDVMGRTWVTDPETGFREHHSSTLRSLVQLNVVGEVVTRAVENPEMGEILKAAPALNNKEAQRQAVVLVLPEDVLKTNVSTEFHQVVRDLWKEQPDGGFYAMSRNANGTIKWWEYSPSAQKSWADSWQPFDGQLQGKFAEIGLIGHKDQGVGLVEGMSFEQLSQEITKKIKTGAKIEAFNLLICGAGEDGGTRLAEQFVQKDIKFSKITASEHLVYLRGRRIVYQPDQNHRHKIIAVSIIERSAETIKVTKHILKSQEVTDRPPAGYAGPFDFGDVPQAVLEKAVTLQTNKKAEENVMRQLGEEGRTSCEEGEYLQNVTRAQARLDDLTTQFKQMEALVFRRAQKLVSEPISSENWIFFPETIKNKDGTTEVKIGNIVNKQVITVPITDFEEQNSLQKFSKFYKNEMEKVGTWRKQAFILGADGNLELRAEYRSFFKDINKLGYLAAIKKISKSPLAKNLFGATGIAFFAMAWGSLLSNQKSISELPVAMQISFYLNLTDNSLNALDDAGKVFTSPIFRSSNSNISLKNNLAPKLKWAGRTFIVLNVGFTIAGIVLDSITLADPKAEKVNKIQAGVSIGGSVMAFGGSILGGPGIGMVVGVITATINTIVTYTMRPPDEETKRTLNRFIEWEKAMQAGGYQKLEGEENIMAFYNDVPIKKIDFETGTVTLGSHNARWDKKENWHIITHNTHPPGEQYNFRNRLSIPADHKIERVSPIRVLPASNTEYWVEYDLIRGFLDGDFAASPAQVDVWCRYWFQNTDKNHESHPNIVIPPRELRSIQTKTAPLPLRIQMDREGTYVVPKGATDITYEFTTSSAGGNAFIQNVNSKVKIVLQDSPNITKGSSIKIHISDQHLYGIDSVSTVRRGEKRFIVLKDPSGEIQEIDISGIRQSSVTLIGGAPDQPEDSNNPKKHFNVWEVIPASNAIIRKNVFFKGVNKEEVRRFTAELWSKNLADASLSMDIVSAEGKITTTYMGAAPRQILEEEKTFPADTKRIAGETEDAFFFHAPTNIFYWMEGHPAVRKASLALPLAHSKDTRITNLKQTKDSLTFTHHFSYGQNKTASLTYEWKSEEPVPILKEIRGLSAEQLQYLKALTMEEAEQRLQSLRLPSDGEHTVTFFFPGYGKAQVKTQNGRITDKKFDLTFNFIEALKEVFQEPAKGAQVVSVTPPVIENGVHHRSPYLTDVSPTNVPASTIKISGDLILCGSDSSENPVSFIMNSENGQRKPLVLPNPIAPASLPGIVGLDSFAEGTQIINSNTPDQFFFHAESRTLYWMDGTREKARINLFHRLWGATAAPSIQQIGEQIILKQQVSFADNQKAVLIYEVKVSGEMILKEITEMSWRKYREFKFQLASSNTNTNNNNNSKIIAKDWLKVSGTHRTGEEFSHYLHISTNEEVPAEKNDQFVTELQNEQGKKGFLFFNPKQNALLFTMKNADGAYMPTRIANVHRIIKSEEKIYWLTTDGTTIRCWDPFKNQFKDLALPIKSTNPSQLSAQSLAEARRHPLEWVPPGSMNEVVERNGKIELHQQVPLRKYGTRAQLIYQLKGKKWKLVGIHGLTAENWQQIQAALSRIRAERRSNSAAKFDFASVAQALEINAPRPPASFQVADWIKVKFTDVNGIQAHYLNADAACTVKVQPEEELVTTGVHGADQLWIALYSPLTRQGRTVWNRKNQLPPIQETSRPWLGGKAMERKGGYFITQEGEIFKIADGVPQFHVQVQVSFYDLPQREEGTRMVDSNQNGRPIGLRNRIADQRMLVA